VENMSSRDPKSSNIIEKRLIHSDLMVERKAREIGRSENVFESGTKLINPQNLKRGEFCQWGTLLSVS